MKIFKNFLFVLILIALLAWCYLPKDSLVEAENIEFSRCSCDNSMYCLTDEQYTAIIAQLNLRKEKF